MHTAIGAPGMSSDTCAKKERFGQTETLTQPQHIKTKHNYAKEDGKFL